MVAGHSSTLTSFFEPKLDSTMIRSLGTGRTDAGSTKDDSDHDEYAKSFASLPIGDSRGRQVTPITVLVEREVGVTIGAQWNTFI